ncbi:hypothetical protein BDD12DRAFT_91000 [Trichophaea hybrida]|nr:hypothetical protein BDD12DRAFT_91000 [Trichophaea hybrida]
MMELKRKPAEMNGDGELYGMFRVLQQAEGGRCSVNRGWPYFFQTLVFSYYLSAVRSICYFLFFVSCRVLPIVLRNQCYIMSLWILEAANLALGSWGRGEWDHVISTPHGCAGEVGIHAGGTADLILFLYFFEFFTFAPPINNPTLQLPGFSHCTRGCNDRLATHEARQIWTRRLRRHGDLQPRLLIAAILLQ